MVKIRCLSVSSLFMIYIVLQLFVTPLYKFCEIYYAFPKLNLSAARVILATFSLSILFLFRSRIKVFKNLGFHLIPTILLFALITFIVTMKLAVWLNDIRYENYLDYLLLRIDTVFFGYPMMFFSGIFYLKYWKNQKNRWIYLWLIFTTFLLVNIQTLIESYFIYDLRPDRTINYIFLASNYSQLALLALMGSKRSISIAVAMFTLILLFFIPSRSMFYIFFAIVLFVLLNKARFVLKFTLTLIAIIIGSFSFSMVESNDILSNSRILDIDMDKDASLDARNKFADLNSKRRRNNLILGDFMSDVVYHGVDGRETHSYVSILEQFGIVPFILYCLALIQSILVVIRAQINKRYDVSDSVILLLYALPITLFTQGFNFNFIWFALGHSLSYEYYVKRID